MKKWKPMLAAVLALGMLATVTSCGASDEEKSPDKSSDNAPVSEAEPEIGVADPDETGDDEEKTEAPTENNSSYKHYDLLAAEYEKTGNTSAIDIGQGYAYHDGKAIFTVSKSNDYYLCTYDINTKELTESKDSLSGSFIYYYNGYVYTMDNNACLNTKKYDLEGNEIASVNDVCLDEIITDEGYIWAENKKSYEKVIISPDFSTITQVPPLKVKDSHGLEQEVSVAFMMTFAACGNKIFVRVPTPSDEYGIFYYDIDSNTWNSTAFTYEYLNCVDASTCLSVGKYCLFGNTYVGIYDMEADEIITESISYIDDSRKINKNYFGRKNNVIYNSPEFYRVQYPKGDNRLDLEELNPIALGTDSQAGYRYPLNDTYYIFKDDAGIFLRTYEKGETEEEIVYVFNN